MDIAKFCEKLVEVGFDPTPQKVTILLLSTFIELVADEQKSIDEKVDALISSYYKDGMAHLENARDTLDEERKRTSLLLASERFITASNIESSLQSVKAAFFVGVCFDLLGDKNLCLKWYEKAYSMSRSLETKLLNNLEVSVKEKIVKTAATFVPLIGFSVDVYQEVQRKKARKELVANREEVLLPLQKMLSVYQS